jgi:hypothetical protein
MRFLEHAWAERNELCEAESSYAAVGRARWDGQPSSLVAKVHS